MIEKTSRIVFEGARDGQQKFDYFMVGLTGALFAYIAQTYKPRELGINPSSLEPLALVFLALSFFIGLKRIETSLAAMRLNHDMLDCAEKAGLLTKAIAEGTGDGYNAESGEFVSYQELPERRQRYMIQSQAAREVLESTINRGARYYSYRNHFLFAGFAAIFLAKLLLPYA
jgi:hypothetical protein